MYNNDVVSVLFVRTEPPAAPQNLTVNFVDQSTVTLSWNPPNFLGGRSDIVYRVTCDMCGPPVVFMPNNVSTHTYHLFMYTISSTELSTAKCA